MSCDDAVECTKDVLGIPIEERSFRELLLDGKLRPSSLWRWSTLNRSRALYPLVKDFMSYVWIRKSLEILGCDMKFLSPITDIERRFIVTSMLNAKINLPNQAEALKRYRDDLAKRRAAANKKKQAADKSKKDPPVVQEHVYTSSHE